MIQKKNPTMKDKSTVKGSRAQAGEHARGASNFSVTRSAFSKKHSEAIAFLYNSERSEIDNMVKTARKVASDQNK